VRGVGAEGADAGDVDAITNIMLRRFDEHRRGIRPAPIARHEALSRRARAAELFEAIEAITGSPPVNRESNERAVASRKGDASSSTPSVRRTVARAAVRHSARRDAS
jgi:hypothetical protein